MTILCLYSDAGIAQGIRLNDGIDAGHVSILLYGNGMKDGLKLISREGELQLS